MKRRHVWVFWAAYAARVGVSIDVLLEMEAVAVKRRLDR